MKSIVILLGFIMLIVSCRQEKVCQVNDTIYVDYKMYISDSIRINENDHSKHCDREQKAAPHKIVLGNREIYPSWEEDILMRSEKESSTVFIPVKDVYHKDAVLDDGNIQLPDTIKIVYTVLEIIKPN